MDAAQLAARIALALDAVHVDVAQGSGYRCEHHFGVLGQCALGLVQALRDLLARPIDVGAVLEVDDDVGYCVLGGRTQEFQAWDALHLHLDRECDARLDLGRRKPRRLDEHLYLRRRNIGEGVDGQRVECPQATGDHRDGDDQHHQALDQCESDERGDHG